MQESTEECIITQSAIQKEVGRRVIRLLANAGWVGWVFECLVFGFGCLLFVLWASLGLGWLFGHFGNGGFRGRHQTVERVKREEREKHRAMERKVVGD